MKLCGRDESDECVYAAVRSMINKMKEQLAERQSIPHAEQIVVAKIYDISATILAEACRRKFGISKAACEPSKQFKIKYLTLDTFILLNQLKEEKLISEEYKQTIFKSLTKVKPEIKKLLKDDMHRGLI